MKQIFPNQAKRWTVQDKYGNFIYLTHERWQHILVGHPELSDYEEHLKTTIRTGLRRQEPLNPRKYRYYQFFDDLTDDFNHAVVIVLFGFDIDRQGNTTSSNFIATAFFKHIWTRNR